MKHTALIQLTDNDTHIWLGGDFNAGGCVTLFGVEVPHPSQPGTTTLCVFREMLCEDTFETGERLSRDYPDRKLYGSFDATGARRTTNASRSDLDILGDAGVSLVMGEKNPHVQDSILSVNSAFKRGELLIDKVNCPHLTKALEQLSYDEVTGQPEKFSGPGTIDDYTDALRYMVWAVKPVTKVTFSTYSAVGTKSR